MIEIFTDGSSDLSNGSAGWAIIIPELDYSRSGGFMGTNNQAELEAIRQAILWAADNNIKSIKIISDSQYSINSCSVWWKKWARQGWPPHIKNQNWIKEIVALQEKVNVQFEWVKGHAGEAANELADSLASEARLIELQRVNSAA